MITYIHYALSIEEEKRRRNGGYVDPSEYAKRPQMLCLTGDGHAVGSRDWKKVTCGRCLVTPDPH